MRTTQTLDRGWRLCSVRLDPEAPDDLAGVGVIAARVPGTVHIDLLAAGLIEDPYLDRHEESQHWIGRSEWRYATRLDGLAAVEEDERVDLVFEGLDTVATVRVDGSDRLAARNQHRTHRVDITTDIRSRNSEASEVSRVDASGIDITVDFDAQSTYAAGERDRVGDLPNPYGMPYNFVRKMACNFGWDWGPRLTTCGIWRPVRIDRWRTARLASVRPSITVDHAGTGIVDIRVDMERTAQTPLELSARLNGVEQAVPIAADATSACLRLEVPEVDRWWPAGYGDQPRYELVVDLRRAGADECLDRHRSMVGFRTVQIDTTPVDDGSRWAIVVNGRRIWIRGTNWIPDDCFPSRVTEPRLRERLEQARQANVNLIRVWGGGVYESDEFYDICDELGLLVWQDFPFACAAYDEDLLRDEVCAEATQNIDRLMARPSLALWCGNNENLWGWWAWGWADQVGDRTWGEGFYRDLLPGILAERDPLRPYLDGSPSSLDPARHPNDQDHGPMHVWTVWNDRDHLHYRDFRPRFVAEFGYQAPPTHATLEDSLSSRPLAMDAPDLLHHQKAHDGHAKLARGLETHFGDTTDFDAWLYLTQLNQARALQVGIGHFRRLHDRCAGAVMWQLNDCWPVVSWAVIDGYGRRKPSWYALRTAFDDRLVVVEPDGDGVAAFLVNDSDDVWTESLAIRRVDMAGTTLAIHTVGATVEPHDAEKWLLPPEVAAPPGPGEQALLVVDAGDRRAVHAWHFDRELRYAPRTARLSVRHEAGRTVVEVHAETLIRDLCLFADRLDSEAVVDTSLVTLLPGERHRFVVDRILRAAPEIVSSAPVLACVNDYVSAR